jgi:hypothetical protein
MRYKDNVLNRITQIEASLQRIQLQLNRGMNSEMIQESLDNTKTQVENLRDIISVEDDEFSQQFRPR